MPSIRIHEEAGVRYLQFGAHWIQGAMRIKRPWSLELEYCRDLMFPLLLRRPGWPRTVLHIGLGAGSTAKFLHRHVPRSQIEVVEIDPEVALAAWQFFRLPGESARFRVEIADSVHFLAKCRKTFDLILLDGFDAKAEAGRMDSPSFYRNCRARLAKDGMFVVNLLSKRGPPTASLKRLGKAFEGRVVALPRIEMNTIAISALGKPLRFDQDGLRGRALDLRRRTGLDLLPTIRGYFLNNPSPLIL